MSEDVGTTVRKPLTPRQRLKLFEDHKGICKLCGLKIEFGATWIDEHGRALGLGGGNELENRYPVHVLCAGIKTSDEDMPRINKAKAQKRSALGIKNENRAKIRRTSKEPKAPLVTAPGPTNLMRRFQ